LIEVLIAVSVISILVGILFIAFKSVGNSAKAKQTAATLEVLKTMVDQMDTATKNARPEPGNWLWRDVTSAPPRVIAAGTPMIFWTVPMRDETNGTAGLQLDDTPEPLDAPRFVQEDFERNRNTHRAILNTQLAMAMLIRIPANRSMVENLSSIQSRVPDFQTGAIDVNNSYPVPGTVVYAVGNVVRHNGGKLYRSVVAQDPPAVPANNPMPADPWQVLTSTPPVIFLDSWNNPILFVPASGLGTGANAVSVAGKATAPLGAVGLGSLTVGQPTTIIKSSDNRPFWASAGPDGDFSTGDDNIYSFEN